MKKQETLHLFLKDKWFDMIASGEKKEEYREIKQYWIRRLCLKRQTNSCKGKDCEECFFSNQDNYMFMYPLTVTFHKHYSNQTISFFIRHITRREGKEEWGAEKGKVYFNIKLGFPVPKVDWKARIIADEIASRMRQMAIEEDADGIVSKVNQMVNEKIINK